MAGEVFTLFARLGIKDDEFNKGIQNASKKGKGLSDGLKKTFKVGAAAIGVATGAVAGLSKAFVGAAKETAAYGDSIDKQSQRVGLSAEAYQKWDYVMKIAGTEMSNMRMGLKTLTNQLDKAKSGGKEAQENFAKLGLSMDDVNKMSRRRAFGAVIKGFQGMKDSTERAALANKMFGRSGQELTPLFNQSAESTEKLIEQAEKYGMIMSDKAVKASADWTDSLTTLSMTADGLKNRLMGEFLPALTEITNGLSSIFAGDYDKGVEEISSGVENLTSKFTELVPKVLDIGGEIVLNLATSIVENLPSLLNTGFSVIMTLAQGIIEQLPTILQTGLQIIISLAQSLTESIPTLLPAITEVIIQLATMLTQPDMLEQLIMSAVTLMLALQEGLIQAIPQLMEAAPTIVINLVKAIIKVAPKLLLASVKMMALFIQGIRNRIGAVKNIGGKVAGAVKDAIHGIVDKAANWGRDLIQNFINGIMGAWNSLKSKVTSIADFFKNILGHSTPKEGPMAHDDRWMPDFMDNLIDGIDKKMPELQMAVNGIAGTMANDYGYEDDYGYLGGEETQRFEVTFEDGNAPLLLIARLLYPYMKIVKREVG